jgi:hypothetical protein
MKTSDQVEQRIEILKLRRQKLQRALERMDDRVADAQAVLQRTREREKPQRLVRHLESVGSLCSWTSAIEYAVTVEVDGETLQYITTTRRPRVLNATLRIEGEIEFNDLGETVLKMAPRIWGGKIWVKEYFIQQMKELKASHPPTPTHSETAIQEDV